MKLDADVTQRDAGVREGETADTGFDDILAKTRNQCVGLVRLELGGVLGQCRLEL